MAEEAEGAGARLLFVPPRRSSKTKGKEQRSVSKLDVHKVIWTNNGKEEEEKQYSIGRREALLLKHLGVKKAIENVGCVSREAGRLIWVQSTGQWMLESVGTNPIGFRRTGRGRGRRAAAAGKIIPWQLLRKGERRALYHGDMVSLLGAEMPLLFQESSHLATVFKTGGSRAVKPQASPPLKPTPDAPSPAKRPVKRDTGDDSSHSLRSLPKLKEDPARPPECQVPNTHTYRLPSLMQQTQQARCREREEGPQRQRTTCAQLTPPSRSQAPGRPSQAPSLPSSPENGDRETGGRLEPRPQSPPPSMANDNPRAEMNIEANGRDSRNAMDSVGKGNSNFGNLGAREYTQESLGLEIEPSLTSENEDSEQEGVRGIADTEIRWGQSQREKVGIVGQPTSATGVGGSKLPDQCSLDLDIEPSVSGEDEEELEHSQIEDERKDCQAHAANVDAARYAEKKKCSLSPSRNSLSSPLDEEVPRREGQRKGSKTENQWDADGQLTSIVADGQPTGNDGIEIGSFVQTQHSFEIAPTLHTLSDSTEGGGGKITSERLQEQEERRWDGGAGTNEIKRSVKPSRCFSTEEKTGKEKESLKPPKVAGISRSSLDLEMESTLPKEGSIEEMELEGEQYEGTAVEDREQRKDMKDSGIRNNPPSNYEDRIIKGQTQNLLESKRESSFPNKDGDSKGEAFRDNEDGKVGGKDDEENNEGNEEKIGEPVEEKDKEKKSKTITQPESQMEKWACTICTFQNATDRPNCVMCARERTLDLTSKPYTDSKLPQETTNVDERPLDLTGNPNDLGDAEHPIRPMSEHGKISDSQLPLSPSIPSSMPLSLSLDNDFCCEDIGGAKEYSSRIPQPTLANARQEAVAKLSSAATRKGGTKRCVKHAQSQLSFKKLRLVKVGGEQISDSVCPRPSRNKLKILSWNANGFGKRLFSKKDRTAFREFVSREDPDVICVQEVNLPAQGPPGCKKGDGRLRNRGKIGSGTRKSEEERAKVLQALNHNVFRKYQIRWSLSDWKYSGTAMFIRKGLNVSSCRNTFPGEPVGHDEEGRVNIATVEGVEIWSTYVPNSGWTDDRHQRRERWDERILKALRHRKAFSSQVPLVWVGDMNVCREDRDASHINFFRETIYKIRRQYKKSKDYMEVGQPGVIPNEQVRFQRMLKEGDLIDAYRLLHKQRDAEADFTWRGCKAIDAKKALYYGKGMRIDYTLVSSELRDNLIRADTIGRGKDRKGFFGSDHCPVILEAHLLDKPT